VAKARGYGGLRRRFSGSGGDRGGGPLALPRSGRVGTPVEGTDRASLGVQGAVSATKVAARACAPAEIERVARRLERARYPGMA
jgi:hypothetical protein